ncbi:MAG: leucine-rich repeat protein [Clostridia bacterium]|nr:leucine-rich repeat protein [Clostridia bacterium]
MKICSRMFLFSSLIFLVLCISLFFNFFVTPVHAETEGYYTYTVEDGKSTITNCDPSVQGNLNIPSTLGGYPVTGIEGFAFNDCVGLSEISIPASITYIGYDAFSGCTELSAVHITDLSAWCKINFDNFDGLFSNPLCYGAKLYLKDTLLTNLIIPEDITSINDYAFWGCSSLSSVNIGDNVTSIGKFSFFNCASLTSVKVGDNVSNIGYAAFSETPWLENQLAAQPDGMFYIGKVAYAFIGEIDENTSFEFEDGTLGIGDYLFYNCQENLGAITIPDSIVHIGDYAFSGCNNLTSVTFPNSLTNIGEGAFKDCADLIEISFLDSSANIGPFAFDGCTSLSVIDFGMNLESIGYGSFESCSSLSSITIPKSMISIGNYAFSDCTNLTEVAILNGATEIKYAAFSNCTSLFSVNLGEEVTSIGDYAFDGCIKLTEITIPSSATYIGYSAFSGCSSLSSVHIYGSPDIAEFAFPNRPITLYGYSDTTVEEVANSSKYFTFIDLNPKNETVPGDCDGDGKITISDLTLLAQYLGGWDVSLG